MKLGNCCKFSLTLTVLYVLGFVTTWPADAGTPMYTITDLGTTTNYPNNGGQINTYATGINNSGQVVGYGTMLVAFSGFRTAPNSPIDQVADNLGALGNSPRGPFTQAFGINNLGQAVGLSWNLPNGTSSAAFRTAPNSPINRDTDDLGSLGGTASISYRLSSASGINDLGQVVGSALTASGETHAFRTAPNSPINPEDDLGTLGGAFSEAIAINQSGRVVGNSTTASGETHAFRTARNQPIKPETDDLGTLGGTSSHATAINRLGRVVGYSTTASGETHAFRTPRNRAINPAKDDLGTLGGTSSQAFGINKLGQVVGASATASGETHAFIYNVRGGLIDLNSLISPDSPSNFSVLRSAAAINDSGQIAGTGIVLRCYSNGLLCYDDTHAFLATPFNTSDVTTQSSAPNGD